jgi:hypothetical protein
MFDQVDGEFGLIVIDPRFRWFAPRVMPDGAITDENYETLGRFFDGVLKRLRVDGRVLPFIATAADVAHLDQLISRAAMSQKVVSEGPSTCAAWTPRLLRQAADRGSNNEQVGAQPTETTRSIAFSNSRCLIRHHRVAVASGGRNRATI